MLAEEDEAIVASNFLALNTRTECRKRFLYDGLLGVSVVPIPTIFISLTDSTTSGLLDDHGRGGAKNTSFVELLHR